MKIKRSYQPLTYITFSMVGITVLAGILLSCNIPIFPGISVNGSTLALTQTTTANASVRVNNFCSMTANIQPGEEHSTILIGGQYKEDIGKTTIATFCNDPNGYAVYAIGYTGGDSGIVGGYNTVLRNNILGPSYDIITGTSTNGLDNDDTSNWAMKLTAVDGTYKPNILSDDNGSFSDYHIVPSTYAKVASYPTATDLDNPASTRLGSRLTTTYAVYISNTQPAGIYEGQVKYVLVHPGAMEAPYYMQNVDEWGSTIAIGQEVTAYDERDNKSYTVRRMCMSGSTGDDGCNMRNSMLWMTQDLDLDLDRSVALTSEDTDLKDGSLTGAYITGYAKDSDGIIYWTPTNSTITSINSNNGSFNGWRDSHDVAYSADPEGGNSNNPWYSTGIYFQSYLCNMDDAQMCDYLKFGDTIASTYFSHTAFASNGNHGKIGNYYNWSAAIASNDSSSITAYTYSNVANNPKNSICPKGWRLPTISSVAARSEFALLNIAYNTIHDSDKLDQGLFDAPIYMIRSGYVYSGGDLNDAGYSAGYWSSTARGPYYAHHLTFRSTNVKPDNYSVRYGGRAVRCVTDY